MSDSATTPAQDTATPSIDTQQLQQPPPPQSLVQDSQLHAQLHQNSQPTISDPPRKRAFPACLIFLLLCLPVRIRWLESLTRIFLLILSKSPSRKACVHFLSFWKDSLQRDPPMSGRYLSISAFLVCQNGHPIVFRVASSVVSVPLVLIRIQRPPLITHSSKPLVRLH
jgi:hypothetical protein